MPWCPKCKTEYREGFRVCADCGSELVREEPADNWGEELSGEFGEPNREEAARLAEDAADIGERDEADGVSESMGESEQESPGDISEIRSTVLRPIRSGGGGLYQDSSEKASDNRSSALVMLGLGILGLVAVVLGVTGILPLHFSNPYLFYGVMGAIFILFVVVGIVSLKNARIFQKKAESENTLRQTLLDWCRENLNAQDIDAAVCAMGISDEIAYFRRSSYIKEKLNHQFVNLNQGFLDQFIDDYIYDEIFGERSE